MLLQWIAAHVITSTSCKSQTQSLFKDSTWLFSQIYFKYSLIDVCLGGRSDEDSWTLYVLPASAAFLCVVLCGPGLSTWLSVQLLEPAGYLDQTCQYHPFNSSGAHHSPPPSTTTHASNEGGGLCGPFLGTQAAPVSRELRSASYPAYIMHHLAS